MRIMKTSIALIGFMGSGKSVVGKALAERLGFDFVDSDALVEQAAGKSVAKIFDESGERVFRELESRAVERASALNYSVVSCGGGVVLRKENVRALKRSSAVVWLDAPLEALQRRLNRGASRPLLRGKSASEV